MLEWGPTDVGNDDVLQIRRWLGLLEGPLDLAYHTTLQPRGNAHIVHSRAKVLGGCSSHNTMIWFKPFPDDWNDWVDQGCAGWSNDEMDGYYDRIPGPHGLVGEADRNAILYDWIESCGSALGVKKNVDWNAAPYRDGAGFLDVGYDPATGVRSSSSVMYLHPALSPLEPVGPDRVARDAHRDLGRPRHGRRGAARLRRSRPDRGPQGDHRRGRLDRHAAAAAVLRHRPAQGPREARHRRRRTTCRAWART